MDRKDCTRNKYVKFSTRMKTTRFNLKLDYKHRCSFFFSKILFKLVFVLSTSFSFSKGIFFLWYIKSWHGIKEEEKCLQNFDFIKFPGTKMFSVSQIYHFYVHCLLLSRWVSFFIFLAFLADFIAIVHCFYPRVVKNNWKTDWKVKAGKFWTKLTKGCKNLKQFEL